MRISFFGAAREVTGSCYLVETNRSRILIDCGMHQGAAFTEAQNFQAFAFDPKTIDAVVVTHAHLDHTGRLPKLVKDGFRGSIYMTPPTTKLAKLVIDDALQIMKEEFKREGRPLLYDEKNIEQTASQFVALDYTHSVSIGDLSLRIRDAGHIFGSGFVEIEEHGGATAAFSGDLGNDNVPILRPTAQLSAVDALVIESTYGNRFHEDQSTRSTKLHLAIKETIQQKGVLIIPAFAIERTQQLLYELNNLVENQHIPSVDIYLDSPLAIKATDVITSYPQYYAKSALRQIASGDDLFDFPGLHKTLSRDDSKMINDAPKPKVIIAGAGMMNGGRILHHLLRYLSSANTTILVVGYQAKGTLGRRLYEGETQVEVLGEKIHVRARIIAIGAYSAHADQRKLVRWATEAEAKPKRIFCTHGESEACAALVTRFQELGIQADAPRPGETFTIA